MTWTLLQKELRQHWLGLLAILAAGLVSNLLLVGVSLARGQPGTPFQGLRLYVIVITVLSALVLNHRLVVVEYQSRTQLFLEALPVARWRMVAVKYCLGLVVIGLLVGVGLLVACVLGWRQDELSPRFVAIVALKAFSAAWLVQSFCFLMGVTGRYRLALYLGLLLGCMFLSEQKQLEFRQFGPVTLLDERFAYEREVIPWHGLQTTWTLAAFFTSLAAGLSLVREGSTAALLAEKMSHREKVFIAAMLCALMFAASTLSEKIKKAPFDLEQAAVAREPGVTVKVASGDETDPESRRLARHVATELAALRQYLGMRELPPVFIVRRRDLDANRYERGELAKSEGVHVRANFKSKDWQDDPFLAWLVCQVVSEARNNRARGESARWVLDGLGWFWVGRSHAQEPLTRDHALALRSLYGVEGGFALSELRQWFQFRERVGEGIASGVAWSGLKSLARRQGPEACQRFLQAVLAADAPKDFRVMLKAKSWQQSLREQTGESPELFFQQWQEELATAGASLAGDLAALPRLTGQVTFVPLSADSRKVRFHVTLKPPPAFDVRYSFLHCQLPFFDEELVVKDFQQEQNSYSQSPEGELPESCSRGQRLCWSFAMEVPALGCEVVSGYTRQEVP